MIAEGIAVPRVIIMLLKQFGTCDDGAGVLGKEEQIAGCKLCDVPLLLTASPMPAKGGTSTSKS